MLTSSHRNSPGNEQKSPFGNKGKNARLHRSAPARVLLTLKSRNRQALQLPSVPGQLLT